MEHENSRVESYVPTAAFYEGKREDSGMEFQNRFAVVDVQNEFSIVAGRGEDLPVGRSLYPYAGPVRDIRRAILAGKCVLTDLQDGSAVFFGDKAFCGLVPALLLTDPACKLALAAERIGRVDLEIYIAKPLTEPVHDLSGICRSFAKDLADCDRAFERSETEWSRCHAARMAEFAGCRGDFGELPPEPFPLSERDACKWTILLLCLFLTLRGVSAEDPKLRMRELGRETVFTGIDFVPTREAKRETPARLAFLEHPAFREVALEETPAGIRFSVTLSQKRNPMEVQALSTSVRFCFLVETV